ncbi:MAG: hypothetical protein IPF53_09300 [Blastocatellia bacterium]|nr:hypothetical protein [Blastocatellia bacterium]
MASVAASSFDGGAGPGFEEIGSLSAGIRIDGSHRRNEIREERDDVVVRIVERDPSDRSFRPAEPLAEHGGLAETGGSRNEREPALQAFVEPGDETRTWHEVRRHARHQELGPNRLHWRFSVSKGRVVGS